MFREFNRKIFSAHALAFLCTATLFFVVSSVALASNQVVAVTNPSPAVTNPSPVVTNDSPRLQNPLKVDSIEKFLLAIIDVILVFALPIIVFFIMYAGFLFTTARGDTAQIEKAKTALLWSVVGGVIVLGAKIIVEVIQGTVAPLLK